MQKVQDKTGQWDEYYALAPTSLGLGYGGVLSAFGGRMDSRKSQTDLAALAMNAIGQRVIASPLQMARVAAATATGNVVQPRLLAYWGGRDLQADYPKPIPLDLPHLDWVQEGMKKVVMEQGGTAHRVFSKTPTLAQRVYGKTGTAQVRKGNQKVGDSAWFVGFYTTGKPESASLAFACQITRIKGGGGGSVCAPVVRDVLQQLEQQQLLGVSNAH